MKLLLLSEIKLILFILGQDNICTCFVSITTKRPYYTQSKNAFKVRNTDKSMVDQQHQQETEEHEHDQKNVNDVDDKGASSLTALWNDGNNAPLSMTLAGGRSLIFAMARRMLIWDESSTLNSTTSKDNSSIDNNEVKQEHELRTLLDSNEAKKHLNVSINAVIVAHYHDGIRMVEYQIVIHRLDQHRQK